MVAVIQYSPKNASGRGNNLVMTELQWLEKQLEKASIELRDARIRMSISDRFSARRSVSRGCAYVCHMVVLELEERIKEIKGN